jgi:hypothetical protein
MESLYSRANYQFDSINDLTLSIKIGCKGRKTPVEILKGDLSNISPVCFNLPPIILDEFLGTFIEHGYHVESSAA